MLFLFGWQLQHVCEFGLDQSMARRGFKYKQPTVCSRCNWNYHTLLHILPFFSPFSLNFFIKPDVGQFWDKFLKTSHLQHVSVSKTDKCKMTEHSGMFDMIKKYILIIDVSCQHGCQLFLFLTSLLSCPKWLNWLKTSTLT